MEYKSKQLNAMKGMVRVRKGFMLMLVWGASLMVSCSEENLALLEETALINEEVLTDFYFQDADDLAGVVMLADDGTSTGGRKASGERGVYVNDHRFACQGVSVTLTLHEESTPEIPLGTIVIDFGEGCTDGAGNERKGKLIVAFTGKRFYPGSTVVTTFQGYSINGIALMGTRTKTNVVGSQDEAPKFSVALSEGKTIWPDGTEAERENCFIREWIRANNPLNDAMVVAQCAESEFAAKGINRRGKAYEVLIIEPLLYKRGCPLAVSGVKQFIDVASGKVIEVNYGDGQCDRVVTVTANGSTRTVEVKKRG
jgi:hypothetical protein